MGYFLSFSVFPSTLLLFDTSAYSGYILPERSTDEEYFKPSKITFEQGFMCKRLNNTCTLFSDESPTGNYRPEILQLHEC